MTYNAYRRGGDYFVDVTCRGGRLDGKIMPLRFASHPALDSIQLNHAETLPDGSTEWSCYDRVDDSRGMPVELVWRGTRVVRDGKVVSS